VSKEPKRMSEEPTLLGASVTAVREELPSDDRLAALAARLNAAGATVEFEPALQRPPAGAPPRAELARTPAWRPRLLALGALAVGAGFVAWRVAVHSNAAPHSESVAEPDAVSAPTSVARTPSMEPMASGAVDAVGPPGHEPPSEANRAAPSPAFSNADTAPAPPASAAELVVPPSAPSRVETAPPSPARVEEPPKTTRRLARSSTTTSGASTDTPQGAPLAANTVVQSELELLKLARSTVAADPAQAYALTERCRAQYPSGDLAQEREYIAISALVRLGRTSEASSRAALFRMHYPSSAYLPRLSRLLGDR